MAVSIDINSFNLHPINLDEDLSLSHKIELIKNDILSNPLCITGKVLTKINDLVKNPSVNFTLNVARRWNGDVYIAADLPLIRDVFESIDACNGKSKEKETPKLTLEPTESDSSKKRGPPALPTAASQPGQKQNQLALTLTGSWDPKETYLEVSSHYYMGQSFTSDSFAKFLAWYSRLSPEEQSLGVETQVYMENSNFKLAFSGEFSYAQQLPTSVTDGGFSLHVITRNLALANFELEGGGWCHISGALPFGKQEEGYFGTLTLKVIPSS